jgi:hypothetical protein
MKIDAILNPPLYQRVGQNSPCFSVVWAFVDTDLADLELDKATYTRR